MSSKEAPSLGAEFSGSGLRVGIITAEFNAFITTPLLEAAKKTLLSYQVDPNHIYEKFVPGAYELPYAAQRLIDSEPVDVIICLGAVIRGDTPHFDYVCAESSRGIMDVSLKLNIPIINGVLTTDTVAQAEERAQGGSGGKGAEFAIAALKMATL